MSWAVAGQRQPAQGGAGDQPDQGTLTDPPRVCRCQPTKLFRIHAASPDHQRHYQQVCDGVT